MAKQGISIKLKTKALTANRSSYYLHIYDQSTGKRKRQYLGLYIHTKAKNALERTHNKEIRSIAQNVYSKSILETQQGNFGIKQNHKIEIPFLTFMEQLIEKKKQSTSESNVSTWNTSLIHMRRFTSKDKKLSEIDENFLNAFKDYLLNENISKKGTPLARNSASTYFNRIQSVINEAFRLNLISENPGLRVSSISVVDSKREFLSAAEIQSLFHTSCSHAVIKRCFLFSVLTGLRISDVARLTWANVIESKENGLHLSFQQKKTKRYEILPINDQAKKLLGEALPDDQLVFEGFVYNVHTNKLLHRWIKAAGIKKLLDFYDKFCC